jgi:hypothetical protein
MPDVLHFYVDDSGTRHPDHHSNGLPGHDRDWFALGGILIKQEHEEAARAQHEAFCRAWSITAPLHSSGIRGKSGAFSWLGEVELETYERFMYELSEMLAGMPIIGHACVIDRPGYDSRYLGVYGRQRWRLCKTAFSVSVERAAKFARREGYKLKVFVERGDKKTDRWMKQDYEQLRSVGMPFDLGTSGRYAPLTAAQFTETLREFKTKHKTSPMMQVADLYLWPICIGGYDPANRPYNLLRDRGKLIDNHVAPEDVPALGIKYSCWELVSAAKAQKR